MSSSTQNEAHLRSLQLTVVFIMENSKGLHQLLLHTVLTIVSESMAFTKFRPLVEMKVRSGVNISSGIQKLNRKVCVELITVLADIVRDMIRELLASETTHFVCLAGDGTEARNTQEEKN